MLVVVGGFLGISALSFVGATLLGRNVTGCGHERPAGLTPEGLAGTYKGSGVTVDLWPDGKYVASPLTGAVHDDFGEEVPIRGEGMWTLVDGPRGYDLDLSVGGSGRGLDVGGTLEAPYLWDYLDDPDSCEVVILRRAS